MGSLPYRGPKTSSRNSEKNPHKRKIDRQLTGQSITIPFMNIQEGYCNNKRTMSFDTKDMLDNNIDKITFMMHKISSQGSNQNRPFKPKIYQGRRREQGRNN